MQGEAELTPQAPRLRGRWLERRRTRWRFFHIGRHCLFEPKFFSNAGCIMKHRRARGLGGLSGGRPHKTQFASCPAHHWQTVMRAMARNYMLAMCRIGVASSAEQPFEVATHPSCA